jgi:hypothetical protein
MTSAPVPPRPATTVGPRVAAAPAAGGGAGGRWRAHLPAVAAATYLAAWVAGLAVWPVNLALNAQAAQVTAAFRQHPAEAAVQFLLVEGLAGLLLGVVLAAGILGGARHSARSLVPGVFAAIAVITSVAQCVIGLMLIAAAARHDNTRCGDLEALVNRLDGVKMLAIAAVALCLAAVPALPRWLRALSVLLAVAIAVSGCAYLALANVLGWTAYISGLLLLAWVAGVGIWVTTSRRRVRNLAPAVTGGRP